MKTLAFLLTLSFAPFARAVSPEMCAHILGIPARHADKFGVYANLDVLTPLRRVEFARRFGQMFLHLGNDIPPNLNGRTYRSLSIEVLYGFVPDHRGSLMIEHVTFPGDLPPAFAYRVILAHLLTRYDYVTEITHLAFEAPDNGPLKEQLARGVAVDDAIKTLPSIDAFRAFGFEYVAAIVTREARHEELYRGDEHVVITVAKP